MNLARSPSVAEFVAALQQSGILQAQQLAEVADSLQLQFATPAELGAELRRRGWFTNYQLEQLHAGKGADLSVGPYILLKPLGEGGMGKVFKAKHRLMDRLVAIKFIRQDLLELPNTVQRFYREIQAAAKLSHPNIVIAYDAAQLGDKHYLVTEFIEGIDLADLMEQRGPLKSAAACLAIRQVALGLQHAHERGMVHRDIKPNNILLPFKGGQVKILDFGLARLHQITLPDGEVAATITQHGTLMGTPDYLAPEQAMDFHQADIRADVYSLGCTLYHLIAGHAPFHEVPTMQKLAKHQFAEPEPLDELVAHLPASLWPVVKKMMAKRPQDRYQTPGEVAEALLPFSKGSTGPQPPPKPHGDSSSDQGMLKPVVMRPSKPPAATKGSDSDTLCGEGVPVPVPLTKLPDLPSAKSVPPPIQLPKLPPLPEINARMEPSDDARIESRLTAIPLWFWGLVCGMGLLIVFLILWILLGK